MSVKLSITLSILVLGVLRPAGATILTFDGLKDVTGAPLGTYGPISQAYGDNVTGPSDAAGTYQMGNNWTPNITTAYRTANSTTNALVSNYIDFWNTGYGDLVNVGFPSQSSGVYGEITLTASGGFLVRLNAFDEAGYLMVNHPGQTVRILDGTSNTILFEQSPTTILGDNGTHSHFTPNLARSSLIIRFAFDDWNVAIDNINFDQVIDQGPGVPEPGTFGLAGLALAALPLLRKIRRS